MFAQIRRFAWGTERLSISSKNTCQAGGGAFLLGRRCGAMAITPGASIKKQPDRPDAFNIQCEKPGADHDAGDLRGMIIAFALEKDVT